MSKNYIFVVYNLVFGSCICFEMAKGSLVSSPVVVINPGRKGLLQLIVQGLGHYVRKVKA